MFSLQDSNGIAIFMAKLVSYVLENIMRLFHPKKAVILTSWLE